MKAFGVVKEQQTGEYRRCQGRAEDSPEEQVRLFRIHKCFRTETTNHSTMTLSQAPTRHVGVIVVVIAFAMVGLAFLFLSAWMGSLQPGSMMVTEVRIVDAQFNRSGHLTLIVENIITLDERATEVRICQFRNNQFTSSWYIVPVSMIIPAGEQRSITVDFKWTAGESYYVILSCERRDWSSNAQLPVGAPPPILLENPFNHPFWHRPSFAYEYW